MMAGKSTQQQQQAITKHTRVLRSSTKTTNDMRSSAGGEGGQHATSTTTSSDEEEVDKNNHHHHQNIVMMPTNSISNREYYSYHYHPIKTVPANIGNNHSHHPSIDNSRSFSHNSSYHHVNNLPMRHRGYHQQANKNILENFTHDQNHQEVRGPTTTITTQTSFRNGMKQMESNVRDPRGTQGGGYNESTIHFSNHGQHHNSHNFPEDLGGHYQSSFRSVREVWNPLSVLCKHRNHDQQTADNMFYLSLPDLNHDLSSARPIIKPEPSDAIVPNRVGYKGRFNTPKPIRLPIQENPITILRETDIVCGRGAPTLFHKGNKNFRDLILQYQSLYLFSKRPDKPRLVWNLLEIITSNGGRFVRRVKGKHSSTSSNTTDKGVVTNQSSCYSWEQMNERQAYDKICQSLREGAPELRRRILRRTTEATQSRNQQNDKTVK